MKTLMRVGVRVREVRRELPAPPTLEQVFVRLMEQEDGA